MVSQQAHLYAQHLARCPSYSAAHHSSPIQDDEDSLPHLRRLFAREIKRNLFEAYLRPNETTINLVSTSISSSSAPGGEAFHFSLSLKGHYVLAYSSSRIHVIDVTGIEIVVRRELKILRRPASTTITDDGSLLAVLSTDMQVDLYDLTGEHPKHTRAVALDHTPRTIALSPTGSVLAAAYDSGVEVSALDPNCLNTERRAVKCYAVDSLSFSSDGTQLLGTTNQSRNPSTVVLTAPYYDPGGNLPEENVSALWTTSILFPNGSRDCSHAVLLPCASEDEASWTFTYDRVFETFRAVRIDDLRNGTTYFTGPTPDSASKLLPSTLPAASAAGDLVSSGFQGSIWLYGVPEDLEALPNHNGTNSNVESEASTPPSQLGRRNSAPSVKSITRPPESATRTPQWQLLCDKLRNTFVEGRKIASLDRVSAITWVHDFSASSHVERLVAVAPGVGAQQPESEGDSINPTDGGRISILDFNYSTTDGRHCMLTIEVGNNEPEILEEEHRDLDTEVALVRRRTVAQRREGNRGNVSRAATTVTRSPRPAVPAMPILDDLSDPFGLPSSTPRRPVLPITPSDQSETASIDDQEAFDAPYSHTSPRSGTTLRRAATAVAVNRRLHPRTGSREHIQYRRADGREEHPHESDADNWVPPPPPYTKDPIPPLPEHIQRSILAETAAATLQRSLTQRAPNLDFPGLDGNTLQRSRTFTSVSSASPGESRRDRFPFPRTMSDSTTRTLGTASIEEGSARRATSPVSPDFDDLYDVSPPGSPQSAPVRASEIAPVSAPEDSESSLSPQLTPEPTPPSSAPSHQIARKPVGANSSTAPAPTAPTPAMQTTIQHPVSPTPQPMPDSLGRRLIDWEKTTESARTSLPKQVVMPPTGLGLTRERMDQDVPQRPNEDHRLTELPPDTPVLQSHRDVIESQPAPLSRRSETVPTSVRPAERTEDGPNPIWRRAETDPVASRAAISSAQAISNVSAYAATKTAFETSGGTRSASRLVMPTADQLARLNSRSNRPPSHLLTDPRRNSATYMQSQAAPTLSQRAVSGGEHSSWGSMQNNPSRAMTQQSFSAHNRGVTAVHGSSPARSNTTYTPKHGNHSSQQSPYSSSPSRRGSLSIANPRTPPSSSSSNLRPPVQRLETIHSVASIAEPSPSVALKQSNHGIVRNPSRAERSAAKNIKDAKKRGWRANMRKAEKKKDRWDGASSAGWTDVSEMRGAVGDAEGEKKTTGKCSVM